MSVTVIEHDELDTVIAEIEGYARGYGLDFFPVIFEMLDYEEINMVASYGGFPTRYPHWRFGMQYEYMQKSYGYGLHKIYEMVINNNPCYAYLLELQPAGRPEAGHRARLRPLRLLQEQRLFPEHQPAHDGRDGEPRQPHPRLHVDVRAATWSRTFSTHAHRSRT